MITQRKGNLEVFFSYKIFLILFFSDLQAKIETGQKFSVIRDGEPMDIPVSDVSL